MGLLDFASGVAVQRVTIESALLPPIELRPFPGGGDDAGGAPSSSGGGPLGLVRPRFTIDTAAGPVVFAPAGAPPDFPWLGVALAAGFVVLLGFAGYGVFRLVKG